MTMESHMFSQLSRKLRASLSRALPLVLLIRNIQRSLETQSLIREHEVFFLDGTTPMLQAEESAHHRLFQEQALLEFSVNSLENSHLPQFTLATQHGEITWPYLPDAALKQESTGTMIRTQMDSTSKECVRISNKPLQAPMFSSTLVPTTLQVLTQLWSNGR